MYQNKQAGRLWPPGRSIYTLSGPSLSRRRGRQRVLNSLKFTAIICIIAAVGTRYLSGPLDNFGRASASASAAALPPENPPANLITQSGTNESTRLQAIVSTWVAANPGAKWGVAVQQLEKGGAAAQYNSSQSFYPASLYKLLILPSFFEKLPYSSWSRTGSSANISIADCVDRMIRLSDNSCGVAVGNYTGWQKANNRLKTLGLSGTNIGSGDAQLHTTAADINTYLSFLFHSTAYPEAKQAVMDSMSKQIYRKGIPAGSSGCVVYDKIGDLNGYTHDAAIVQCPNTTYSLSILSKGGSYAQIADLAHQVNYYFNP